MTLDFFATWPHYADHLIPIYHEMDTQAGDFFVSAEIYYHVKKHRIPAIQDVAPVTENPMIVASNNDLRLAYLVHPGRRYILMEHGVGIVFPGNPSYAGNGGHRGKASLTLAPNKGVHDLTAIAYPNMPQEIIGTPRMDEWAHKSRKKHEKPEKPTVAVTFHWDGSAVAPEAGTAFRHYKLVLPKLNKRYDMKLIAHAHPKSLPVVRQFFKTAGIEYVEDVRELFERADILVNDCSSLLYEFMLTGKPVIILNAPWFRREIDYGVRFWRYTDIGQHVDKPEELLGAIFDAYDLLPNYISAREKARSELYPYFGTSARTAANILRRFLSVRED